MNDKYCVDSLDRCQQFELVKNPIRNCRELGGAIVMLAGVSVCQNQSTADAFGSGANSFNIAFVNIGNPCNAADTMGDPSPAGSVGYSFRMGIYEVSEDMVAKANSLGGLGITISSRGANKPASDVSWNEAARFVNWLNESSGYSPAYKFNTQPAQTGYSPNDGISLWQVGDAGYNAANPYRNADAHYYLPSTDEWYKAAYYNPESGSFFRYPTGSDSAPRSVVGGTASGTAVYYSPAYPVEASGPADITNAGGLSPYGTMGQGGNVFELLETSFAGGNGNTGSPRLVRGGYWVSDGDLDLRSSGGGWAADPDYGDLTVGFRVVAVPEPERCAGAVGIAILGAGVWTRRKKAQSGIARRAMPTRT